MHISCHWRRWSRNQVPPSRVVTCRFDALAVGVLKRFHGNVFLQYNGAQMNYSCTNWAVYSRLVESMMKATTGPNWFEDVHLCILGCTADAVPSEKVVLEWIRPDCWLESLLSAGQWMDDVCILFLVSSKEDSSCNWPHQSAAWCATRTGIMCSPHLPEI